MTGSGRTQELPEFSLVTGGPLHDLLVRLRLASPPLGFMPRRIVVIALIAWLPLLVLSVLEGHAVGGGVKIPFLLDLEAQVRLLVALPVLIFADLMVFQRLKPVMTQFTDKGIVIPEDRARFVSAIASATRAASSYALEIGLLVLVLTLGRWLWRSQIAMGGTATWYSRPSDTGMRLTLAGCWYAWVSVPIFQFILVRWYARLLIWFRCLWQISRLHLRLIATHPDHAGGINFLGYSTHAFLPILFAQGAQLAGLIANLILFDGQRLVDFKVDIAGVAGLALLVMLAPLALFSPKLAEAKRRGRREYGGLAFRYVREFEDKWVHPSAPTDESLIGHSDVQSLADMLNSYGAVRTMRIVPFNMEVVGTLVAAILAPLLPLLLTMFSLEELVERVVKLLL